jgi:4-hydroxy-3-polyprenylbenzoate decarboxylase
MKPFIIGISGASGAIYGVRLLEVLARLGRETHLVMTPAARRTIEIETTYRWQEVEAMASFAYSPEDVGAPLASGSWVTEGMMVVPCSMKSLSAIANSYADNLLTRAADVTIKEGRRLVLAVRETPLHAGHLELMLNLARRQVIILPPMPAFYHQPQTIADVIDHTTGKILDQFGIKHDLFVPWQGETAGRK